MDVNQDPTVGNTHVVVSIDTGECYNLHPTGGKDLIGLRLAQGAKKLIYGQNVYYQGPIVRSAVRSGNTISLSYGFADKGMVSTKPDRSVSNFQLRDADGVYHPANAKLRTDGWVDVTPRTNFMPTGVSYAFINCPVIALDPAGQPVTFGVDLVNGVGYPALPFRELLVP